ncbi:hypothetical protein C791_5609 [Amycolatopsis azurea DSM 43854]|uniref:Uncharacterized protein n=1 Tax=Amycolatopsis azurea DSM 43854 TaxID=1238180 RepID=M2NQM4_9PSEU|nr:hypothetical protein C791_5609 [Amycolatopsis azurea DSM 43854]
MTVLPPLPGGQWTNRTHRTKANGINARGDIVGLSDNGDGQLRAVRWLAATDRPQETVPSATFETVTVPGVALETRPTSRNQSSKCGDQKPPATGRIGRGTGPPVTDPAHGGRECFGSF